ncbi:hypothetical protein CGRA01v4_04124 [Colletotrichum graminicola]|nr:hypothetical protein CGRA01v4_04124 [Colletotrichum graminicola]
MHHAPLPNPMAQPTTRHHCLRPKQCYLCLIGAPHQITLFARRRPMMSLDSCNGCVCVCVFSLSS